MLLSPREISKKLKSFLDLTQNIVGIIDKLVDISKETWYTETCRGTSCMVHQKKKLVKKHVVGEKTRGESFCLPKRNNRIFRIVKNILFNDVPCRIEI